MVQHTIIVADNGRDDITVYTKEPAVMTIAMRSDLNALKQLPEAQRAGIYILLGENRRYIGQAATSVYSRLYLHDKEKTWWNQVIFFGREDGHLDKSQLDYLEALLIKEFHETGFQLDNATQGNSSWIDKISKIHADNIWNITQNILEDIANIQLFELSDFPAEDASNPQQSNAKYQAILTDGHRIEGKNPTNCYVNVFRYLLQSPKTKDKVAELIQNGEPNSRFLLGNTERFDKSGMKLTSQIAPHVFLFNNLSTADKKRALTRFVESIGETIQLQWE